MGRKKIKKQKLHKHEYVIFIGGGIIAVAVAIIAAYLSAQSGEDFIAGYWIQIQTSNFTYYGRIYNSDPGKAFKNLLPLAVTGTGKSAYLSIPVDIEVPNPDTVSMNGDPGDILFIPEQGRIMCIGDVPGERVNAVRLGTLDDYASLHWDTPVRVSVRIMLRD